MPVPSSLKSSLAACEKVVDAVRANPKLLEEPELAFLKRLVEDYDTPDVEDDDVPNLEVIDDDDDAPEVKASEAPPPPIPKNAAEVGRFPSLKKDDDPVWERRWYFQQAPEDADWSLASSKKSEASELTAAGDFDKAVACWTAALEAEAATASLSAATLAKRAECLLKMDRPRAAMADCTAALDLNPDSARAFKVRGKARKALGEWVGANLDLAAAQRIDFDPDLAPLCEEVKDKAAAAAAMDREKQREADLAKRKAAAAAKRRADQEAQAKAQRSAGPMPGGMGGGMGGMGSMPGGMGGGMGGMMNDPAMQAAMSNPKVMAAMQEIISGGMPDPAKLMKYMSDPEVGPIIQKMMGAMGGGMGGMGGMGGGMSGGMGGTHGFDPGSDDDGDDDGGPSIEEVDEVD